MEEDMKKKFKNRDEEPKPENGEDPEQTAENSAEEAAAAEEEIVKDLKPLLEASRQKAEEYLNLAQRVQADFDNFRKRNNSVRADAYEEGARDLVTSLLPVIDNLERAIDAAEKHEGGEALSEGVRMTLNSLMESLKRFGFEEVPAMGEPFDPEKHNAVMREVTDDPGKVIEVFQKGYRVKDRIIRYAMVKVSVEG